MSLKEAVNYATSKLTMPQVARVLGVSSNQIYKYTTGYTTTCRDEVIDKIYDNFKISGEPILVNVFNDEEEYLQLRKVRENLKD